MKKLRILVVDDHPLVRDGVRLRLESVHEVEVIGEASNAVEAIALAEVDRPDIVLTDLGMRGLTGLQLARTFRERFPEVYVLVLSMHDNIEYVRRSRAAGARGYVTKDAPAQDLIDAILLVGRGGTYFKESDCAEPDPDEKHLNLSAALTPREREILYCLARGYSNKQIAAALGLSVRTAESHRLSIKRKLNIYGQAELVKYAIERTVVDRETGSTLA